MKTLLAVLILVAEASVLTWIVFAADPQHAGVWMLPGLGIMWWTKMVLKQTLWRQRDNDPGPVA